MKPARWLKETLLVSSFFATPLALTRLNELSLFSALWSFTGFPAPRHPITSSPAIRYPPSADLCCNRSRSQAVAASSLFMPSIMQIFLAAMANNLAISQRRLIDSYCAATLAALPTAVPYDPLNIAG